MNKLSTVQGQVTTDPVYNMGLMLDNLPAIGTVPQPNKYYTFVYKAKTPGIQYDRHPLILSGSIFPWGFTGENVHWNDVRRYTWGELLTTLYELNEEEFETAKNMNTEFIRSN